MNVRPPRAERKERFNSAKDFARWPVVLATLQPQQQKQQQQWPIHHPSSAKQKFPQEKEKNPPITNEPKRSVSTTPNPPPIPLRTNHSLHTWPVYPDQKTMANTQNRTQWRKKIPLSRFSHEYEYEFEFEFYSASGWYGDFRHVS